MAVNIEVDEPEIDIRVRTYDGYVEVTGISVPLSVGDARVAKGDLVDAGPATTALMVGDAQTSKGDAVGADGTSTALVTGDATTQKGDGVAAGGTDVQVAVGGAETGEGESTQADGVSAPLAVGQVQTRHLKPEHRWQMPQPRNLLDDPESFDPSATNWGLGFEASYDGVASNVGPNGEDADQFTLSTSTKAAITSIEGTITKGPLTQGFYIRSVSSSFSFDLVGSINGNGDATKTFTVDTSWKWISFTWDESDTGGDDVDVKAQIVENNAAGNEIYLLRAGLNRGSSLEYSTRSAVPQTIPDVVAGADLTNGSRSGADTNDLDFGVDGSGVPYAVSDGDDQTSTLPQDGTETRATRVYIPSSVGADVEYLGRTDYAYPTLVYDDGNGDLRLRYKDSGGTAQQGPRVSASEGQWHSVAITVDGSDLRLNVGGTTDEQTGTDLNITADPRLLGTQSGARVQHPEQHPVLTEANAEAVRQRLATNPSDPIAKTEAWDSTVGSGNTLPALRQSSNDISVGANVSWVAPIGLSDDGGGSLLTPTKRPTVTWIERVKYTATRAFGRSANGWKVTATDLVVEDTNGNIASTAHGKTINDGAYHTLAVTIDEVAAVAEVYIDGATSPDATVDLSTVGTLKSSDVELLAEGGTIKQPAYYTRTLTGQQIAYLHERLVDNPESAFPTYALP